MFFPEKNKLHMKEFLKEYCSETNLTFLPAIQKIPAQSTTLLTGYYKTVVYLHLKPIRECVLGSEK